jgi:C1A family cysteine protease
MVGGHAVTFVGFDSQFHDNPAFKESGLHESQVPDLMYEVRNSFGAEWGDGGYFWMPAPYVETRDLSDDFWMIMT